MIEGIDYSSTSWSGSPSVEALRTAGHRFVGRYVVGDKSPAGRGITADEYRRMLEGGIDVFLYWQTTTNWMLDGWPAGVRGAQNAQANLLEAGIPPETPIYFAVDFDASLGQMEAIHACLRGCASVLGVERVGVYGGWRVIDECAKHDTARWFCQTLAWMYGRGWHPKAHLHQYGFNYWLDGTNCDRVRATVDNYGQAFRLRNPQPKPAKIWPKPWIPEGWEDWVEDPNCPVKRVGGIRFRPVRMKFEVEILTTQRTHPDPKSQNAGPKLDTKTKLLSAFIVDQKDSDRYWIQTADGVYVLGSRCSPRVKITPWDADN